jgi:hypothetical protein
MRRRTGCWTLPATGRARRDCAGDGRLALPNTRSLTENSATGMSQSGPRDGSRTAGNRPGGNWSRNGPSGDSRSLRRHLARRQQSRARKARPQQSRARKARPQKARQQQSRARKARQQQSRPRETRPQKARPRETRPRTPRPGNASHRPGNRSPSRSASFAEIPFMIASIRPAAATAWGPGEWPQSPAFPGIARRTGRAMRSTPLCRDRRPLIRRGPSRLRRLARRFCHIRRPVHRSRLYRRGIRLTTAASCRAIHRVRRRPAQVIDSRPGRLRRTPRPVRLRLARLPCGPAKWHGRRRGMSPALGRMRARRHSPPAGRIRHPSRSAYGPGSRRSRAPRCRQSLRLVPGSISRRRRAR